jgi:hypothetical protein
MGLLQRQLNSKMFPYFHLTEDIDVERNPITAQVVTLRTYRAGALIGMAILIVRRRRTVAKGFSANLLKVSRRDQWQSHQRVFELPQTDLAKNRPLPFGAAALADAR